MENKTIPGKVEEGVEAIVVVVNAGGESPPKSDLDEPIHENKPKKKSIKSKREMKGNGY